MNRYREALDNVKADREDVIGSSADGYVPYTTLVDIKLLQDLVDRATPMKPIITHLLKMNGECRKCHSINANIMNFCWYCGQALDWSE